MCAAQVTVVEADSTDSGLRRDWRELAVRAENPFATPEWHAGWLRTHPEVRPLVLTARSRGELLAVLPLTVRRGRHTAVVEFPGDDLADFSGPACAPEDERHVAGPLVGAVLDRLGPSDVWRVDRCLAGGGLERALGGLAAEHRLTLAAWRGANVLVGVPLSAGASPLRRGRDRRELDRLGRRLAEQHGVSLRETDAAHLDGDLADLLALLRSRWSRPEGQDPERFLSTVVRASFSTGLVRLWVLEASGRMVAGLLGWSLSGRSFAHLMAFDPEYAALGPGTVLLARAVLGAAEAGDHTFDFLRGDERHKRPYVTELRDVHSYLVARPRTAAALAVSTAAGARAAHGRLPAGARSAVHAVSRRVRHPTTSNA